MALGHDTSYLILGPRHGGDERGCLIDPNEGRSARRGAHEGEVATTKLTEGRGARYGTHEGVGSVNS